VNEAPDPENPGRTEETSEVIQKHLRCKLAATGALLIVGLHLKRPKVAKLRVCRTRWTRPSTPLTRSNVRLHNQHR
jgi:hypothetical protein